MKDPLIAQALPIDTAAVEDASEVMSNLSKPLWTEGSRLATIASGWEEALINFGVRVLLAIVLFFVGRWLIKHIKRFIDGVMRRRQLEGVAVSLINSLLVAGLYIVLGIAIAGTLGVQSVSFAAVLASMGLAVGMALSGQLQNLAGGVILVITKPFTIGHYIQAEGVEGTVKSVSLFHTVITTLENKTVYIPNGALSSGVIINFNEANIRRLEWIIGVDYDADIDRAIALLHQLIQADKRMLTEPEPFVSIKALSASSVDIVVRTWVCVDDYRDVLFGFNLLVLKEFQRAGISFPFPQVTISQRP